MAMSRPKSSAQTISCRASCLSSSSLVRQLPDGVYLTSLKQENQVVTIQGMAQSNERVSELLRNLASKSPWIVRPDLGEITASSVQLGPRDTRRVYAFTLKVKLLRASEVNKAQGAASGAVQNWRLDGCTLYATLEPCPMCAGAILNGRISRVVYGSKDKRLGALGSTYSILEGNPLNRVVEVQGEVLAEECLDLVRAFFQDLRKRPKLYRPVPRLSTPPRSS